MEVLAQVPDHRRRNRSHALPSLLGLAVCGMLCGARSLYAIAQWGRDYGDEIVAQLGFKSGRTPCCATLHNVFKELDVDFFEAALLSWFEQRGGLNEGVRLALDGKTLRGSQGHEVPGVRLVAAFSHQLGIAVAQADAGGPGQELISAKALLKQLDLKGVIVTGDALYTQRGICQDIVEGGGDFFLS